MSLQNDRSEHNLTVLVSAEPGMLRASLLTLLASVPFVTIGGSDHSVRPTSAALQAQPDAVVIFECAPPGRWVEPLRTLHAQAAQVKIIAITDRLQTSRLALAAGAAAVLYYGFSSQDLQAALRQVTGRPAEAPIAYFAPPVIRQQEIE
jgi:AmiR/NasT family two-component response regulator